MPDYNDNVFTFDDEDQMNGVSEKTIPLPLTPKIKQITQPGPLELEEDEDEYIENTPTPLESFLGRYMSPDMARKIFYSSKPITEPEIKKLLTPPKAIKLAENLLSNKEKSSELNELKEQKHDQLRITLLKAIAAAGENTREEQNLTDLANAISLETSFRELKNHEIIPVSLGLEYCLAFSKKFSSGTKIPEANIDMLSKCLSAPEVLTKLSKELIRDLQKSLNDVSAEKLSALLKKSNRFTEFSAEQFANIIKILSPLSSTNIRPAIQNLRSEAIKDFCVAYLEKTTDSFKKPLSDKNQKIFMGGVKLITNTTAREKVIAFVTEKNNYRPNRVCAWLNKKFPNFFSTGKFIAPWVQRNSLSPLELSDEDIENLKKRVTWSKENQTREIERCIELEGLARAQLTPVPVDHTTSGAAIDDLSDAEIAELKTGFEPELSEQEKAEVGTEASSPDGAQRNPGNPFSSGTLSAAPTVAASTPPSSVSSSADRATSEALAPNSAQKIQVDWEAARRVKTVVGFGEKALTLATVDPKAETVKLTPRHDDNDLTRPPEDPKKGFTDQQRAALRYQGLYATSPQQTTTAVQAQQQEHLTVSKI